MPDDFGMEYPGVDVTAFGREHVQVLQAAQAA